MDRETNRVLAEVVGRLTEGKMLLKWENGKCTNPPVGWDIQVQDFGFGPVRRGGDSPLPPETRYSWLAVQGSTATEMFCGAEHTEQAAQRHCEADLLRLGVLPLPEWRPMAGSSCDWLPVGDVANCKGAALYHYRHMKASVDVTICGLTVATAKTREAAKSCLRALLADAIERGEV